MEDNVPNVAFYALKLIKKNVQYIDADTLGEIRMTIQKMLTERKVSDRDVIYFAMLVLREQ